MEVSREKEELFDLLWEGISNWYGDDHACIITNNSQIQVEVGGETFFVTIGQR